MAARGKKRTTNSYVGKLWVEKQGWSFPFEKIQWSIQPLQYIKVTARGQRRTTNIYVVKLWVEKQGWDRPLHTPLER